MDQNRINTIATENTHETPVESNGTTTGKTLEQGQVEVPAEKTERKSKGIVYATEAECVAALDNPKAKCYKVTKGERVCGWVIEFSYDAAIAVLARNEGYTVNLAGSTTRTAKPLTAEKAGAMLAGLDEEAAKALGLDMKTIAKLKAAFLTK